MSVWQGSSGSIASFGDMLRCAAFDGSLKVIEEYKNSARAR